MIRDRLKGALKKMALKAFGMEWEAEARTTHRAKGSTDYDASKIPKLVDGDGDTPGPNHKELIGRTVLAAQVVADSPDPVFDIRPPQEWSSGIIPRAHMLPGRQVLDNLHLLPKNKDDRISIYDATGEQQAFEVAEELRKKGYTWARSLQGGWAEWIEQSEPVEKPAVVDGMKFGLGDAVEFSKGGKRGTVQRAGPKDYDVLMDPDEVRKNVPESELA
ncbi:MAG: rhodanese-like domain-containing protein [Proteobacteria bacterium]|nr:rhodanese-like domain-containing protein [Pseudomonadota bacterium]